MNFWTKFAINEAIMVVQALLASKSTTPEHQAKLQAFIAAGQDLLNSW